MKLLRTKMTQYGNKIEIGEQPLLTLQNLVALKRFEYVEKILTIIG